jgi:hypothetical protein
MNVEQDNEFKVRLTASSSSDRLEDKRRSVVFDVTPDLIENRNINYKTLDPLHAPGQIYVYSNTSSRTFNLSNVKLISRTPKEASKNLERLWTLRGWTMPSFGQSSFVNHQQRSREEARRQHPTATQTQLRQMIQEMNNTSSKQNTLGSPPQVLLLSAYSKAGGPVGTQGLGHLRRVPVVIQQLSIPYPSDVDYIPTDDEENPTPMPVIMTLDATLVETHSPSEFERFSLDDFKTGNLAGF